MAYSPYGLQGMRGMNPQARREVMEPQGPSDKPNYPMYGIPRMPQVRPPYGTTWQNFRGGRQGPPSMYGGLGSYGNMMGGYGNMMGGYGGGMRPPPQPPGQYGSPLTNQFRYGLMGANPAAYSQSLRQMGYYQPTMPAQTDLQNLMGYQQSSFNPYMTGPTTTPDPNATTTTPGYTTPGYTTTQGPYGTTTQGPYGTTTQGPYGTTTPGPGYTTPGPGYTTPGPAATAEWVVCMAAATAEWVVCMAATAEWVVCTVVAMVAEWVVAMVAYVLSIESSLSKQLPLKLEQQYSV